MNGEADMVTECMENRLLRLQLLVQEQQLHAMRERIAAAADAERRRLERDLHDGAQSRFVAIAVQLRRAQARAAAAPDVAELLDAAVDELMAGVDELRALSHGHRPRVLTERGLDAALEALADRAA